MRTVFTKTDVGCWSDGAYGHEHLRARLGWLLVMLPTDQTRLIRELESEPSDDMSEEDDAITALQEYTEEGFVWGCDGGDLMLLAESEID